MILRVFSIISLIIIGIFANPIFTSLVAMNGGNYILLVLGFFIGWCMGNLSGKEHGIGKMLAQACLFIWLTCSFGIFGIIAVIIIGFLW